MHAGGALILVFAVRSSSGAENKLKTSVFVCVLKPTFTNRV